MMFSKIFLTFLIVGAVVAIATITVLICRRRRKVAIAFPPSQNTSANQMPDHPHPPRIPVSSVRRKSLTKPISESTDEDPLARNGNFPYLGEPTDVEQNDKEAERNDEVPATEEDGSPEFPDQPSASFPELPHEPLPADPTNSFRPTRYNPRHGARRAVSADKSKQHEARASVSAFRRAEVGLRLYINRNRKSVHLSIVLSRPEGFPDRIELKSDGIELKIPGDGWVCAFNDERYDDVEVDWTSELLKNEFRLADTEQRLTWIRRLRPFHIFAPGKPGEFALLTVSKVTIGAEHVILCHESAIPEIHAVAKNTGSQPLQVIQEWMGIPPGWVVVTGYTPVHSCRSQIKPDLRPLDPLEEMKIQLVGGLHIRGNFYAEGWTPRIFIEPFPHGCEVRIDECIATSKNDNSWEVPGFDSPGKHLIDVIPGPSLTYQILPDPGVKEYHQIWNAHPAQDFLTNNTTEDRIVICGAHVSTATNSTVIACESKWNAVALGKYANAQALIQRNDAPAVVAILCFEPSFIVLSSGRRRHQGKVIWLGHDSGNVCFRDWKMRDMKWANRVRSIAARRLNIYPNTAEARFAWRSAAVAARRVRREKT